MITREAPRAPAAAPNIGHQLAQQHDSTEPRAGDSDEASWEHISAADHQFSLPYQDRSNQSLANQALNNIPSGEAYSTAKDAGISVWDEVDRQEATLQETRTQGESPESFRPAAHRAATNPFLKRKPVPQATGVMPLAESFERLDVNEAVPALRPGSPKHLEQEGSLSGQLTPQRQPARTDSLQTDARASEEKQPLGSQRSTPPNHKDLLSFESEQDETPPKVKDDAHQNPIEVTQNEPLASLSSNLMDAHSLRDTQTSSDKGKGKTSELPSTGQTVLADDWNLIDADPSIKTGGRGATAMDEKPPLPSRSTGLQQKWVPSRLPVDAKAETYQVKNIRWLDGNSDKQLRTTPILIQNENGPCPLVALVNALTMTTSTEGPEATLVEVLRSREQISLDLLLKAVFEELMSPMRTHSEVALPDVSDLYTFLQSLHTGMNVNPRFIPTPEMLNAYQQTSLTNLDPIERGNLIPGTFENTMEMSLYATFSIPLIHGWLPVQADPVYSALERQAASYEDVQNLFFREEELEELLNGDGLSEDEQQLYEDIATIKIFLESSATQLTQWGIEVIGKAMRPGTFAILFRNDHFSTLYCHPETLQLLSLVTDAGYRTHDEIVWETLADVNGEQTKYLSGDFRMVGANIGAGSSNLKSSTADRGGDSTKIESKRGKDKQQSDRAGMSALPPPPPPPPPQQHEQEDRDLALAFQLQEEEDQRHRAEQSRRRRESILSEKYIEQQGHRPSPVNRDRRRPSQTSGIAPERRSSNSRIIPVTNSSGSQARQAASAERQSPFRQQQQQQVRSLVPPHRPAVTRPADLDGDDAPPSYEQAAQDAAYVPPMGHPNHSQSSFAPSTRTAVGDVSTARAGQGFGYRSVSQPMRRQPMSQGMTSSRDRDCVVM